MLEIQKSLRRTLVKISTLSNHLGKIAEDEEFKEILVEIYIAVVDFWVEAVKDVRKHPFGFGFARDSDQPWKDIKFDLNRTLAEIERQYVIIIDLANQAFAIPAERAFSALSMQRQHQPSSAALNSTPAKSRAFVMPMLENTQFLGRDELLQRIHGHLRPTNRGTKLHCFTIYGMGGVGKTQTAAAYAYRYTRDHTSEYDAVFWVDGENEDSLRQSFTDIAIALRLPGITESTDPQCIRREVHSWLSENQDTEWLFIYDNVDSWTTIMPYWPQGPSKGSIIITSRDFALSNRPASSGEELSTLDPKASQELFRSLLNSFSDDDETEQKACDELLECLDGLPLAIQQITSLLNLNDQTVDEFLQLYKRHRDQIYHERGVNSYDFYAHSLHTVWRFAFDNIALHQETMFLLGIISFLSPDGFPKDLFHLPSSHEKPPAFAFSEDRFMVNKLITKLRSMAMVRQSGKSVTMHRLTQAAFLDFIDFTTKSETFAAASILLHRVFPHQDLGNPMAHNWGTCALYAAHARSLALHWSSTDKNGQTLKAPLDFVDLLCNCAWYLREIGDFDGAHLLVDVGCRAVDSQSFIQPSYQLSKAHLLNTRGVVFKAQFEYSQSRRALRNALALRSTYMKPDHIEVIGVKGNLASLSAAEGRYQEAQTLYHQAEADLVHSTHKARDKRLAACRYAATNGRLYTELGDYESAEREIVRSSTILASGPDNVLYRRAIEYCFGNLRLAQKKYADASQHYNNCLNDYNEIFTDKDRVRTCGCYYKLALIQKHEGHPQEARENLRKASNLASQIDSLGWQGRIVTLGASILRQFPGDEDERTQSQNVEQLEKRADAISAALNAISGEEETIERGFILYIPWQTR